MEPSSDQLNIGLLWPNWNALADWVFGGTQSLAGLSAGIVSIIIVLTVGFSLRVLWGWYKSRRQIKFYVDLLSGVSADQLISSRRDLCQKAQAKGLLGNLWLEFDETLVASPDENLLWNTVDADYFFNTHTLARGITESRLIAAVPGFLTALGVIGTFIGLQLGLAGIDFGSSLVNAQAQMQRIISGASVAFMTSVWGISASVIFNFYEKAVEQALRKKISSLQNQIDTLFLRMRPEQMLVKIEDHGRESRNAMQGLAEKIGEKMQEATLQMADRIQEGVSGGLQQVLGPAINQLVAASNDLSSRQAEGSEEALAKLLEGFVGKMGDHALAQREMMSRASEDVKTATSALQSGMDGFLNHMTAQVDAMKSGQLRVLDKVRETVDSHTESTENVIQQSNELARRVENMAESLTGIGVEIRSASESMQSSTASLDQLANKTNSATNQLSGVLDKAIETTERYVAESQNLASRISASLEFLKDFDESIKGSADNLESVSNTVRQGLSELREHQAEFLSEQQKQVGDLSTQLSDLLKDYGDNVTGQTIERLNVWNEQTREFLESLTNAVYLINDTVTELENRVAPHTPPTQQ